MAFSLTVTPGLSPIWELNALRATVADLNVTSYVNPGGETLLPETFGMKRLLGAVVIVGQRGFVYNFTRVAQGTSLKMTIAQDVTPAATAALPEITNANAHGAVTVLVFGS